jgi:hypothetical protein
MNPKNNEQRNFLVILLSTSHRHTIMTAKTNENNHAERALCISPFNTKEGLPLSSTILHICNPFASDLSYFFLLCLKNTTVIKNKYIINIPNAHYLYSS